MGLFPPCKNFCGHPCMHTDCQSIITSGSRDPGITNSPIPNPVLRKMGPGLQCLYTRANVFSSVCFRLNPPNSRIDVTAPTTSAAMLTTRCHGNVVAASSPQLRDIFRSDIDCKVLSRDERGL